MNIKLATTIRSARITLVRDALDANASPGYFELYTGTQPATGGAAITTQIKLGTLTLSKPCGTISNGVLTFDAIADDAAADDSGQIAWARFYDGGGNFVMDGDCGDNSSNALVKFNSLNVLQGGLIEILSGSLTEGNA
jgi:hypothetical protein